MKETHKIYKYLSLYSFSRPSEIHNSKLNVLFTPNEPNLKIKQNDVSHFQKANCLKLKAKSCQKNEPKRTQFVVPASSRKLSTPQASSLTSQGYVKIPNKPNLPTSQNAVSQMIKKTSIFYLLSSAPENKPKTKPNKPNFLQSSPPAKGEYSEGGRGLFQTSIDGNATVSVALLYDPEIYSTST